MKNGWMWKRMVVVAIEVLSMAAKNIAQLRTRHDPPAAVSAKRRGVTVRSGRRRVTRHQARRKALPSTLRQNTMVTASSPDSTPKAPTVPLIAMPSASVQGPDRVADEELMLLEPTRWDATKRTNSLGAIYALC